MKLTIVSHTPHYQSASGEVKGWGPTIREINHLRAIFSEITHVAPLHEGEPPQSALPYESGITLVPLRPAGGATLRDKWAVLRAAFFNISILWKQYQNEGWLHLRAPANIMLYALPLLRLRSNRQCWVKYAGSWRDANVSRTFRWQRWALSQNLQGSLVTVNGRKPQDLAHIISFENPCLEKAEIELGQQSFEHKDYSGKINLCFVGQLEAGKGILQLLEAVKLLDASGQVDRFDIVGDGKLRQQVKALSAQFTSIKIYLHGYLQREAINLIYAGSHINILPSDSEGFPKVIAEGAAYGAIPVVTDISSLAEYINDTNGRLLSNNSPAEILRGIQELLAMESVVLKSIASNAVNLAQRFTYDRFLQQIREQILALPDPVD